MSKGGVVKGRPKILGNSPRPDSQPSMTAFTAIPNITLVKKNIPTKTLVTCQTKNFRGDNLKLSKSNHSGGILSMIPPERINLMMSLITHQVMDRLFLKSTLKKTRAERTSPPSKPKYMGLMKSSPNSERLSQKITISRLRKTAKILINTISSSQYRRRLRPPFSTSLIAIQLVLP